MEKQHSTQTKTAIQVRVAEINKGKVLDQYSCADLADAMQMLSNETLSNDSEVISAIYKLQEAINKRLTRITKGEEPLSVDDIASLKQLGAYTSDDDVKSKLEKTINKIIAEIEVQ